MFKLLTLDDELRHPKQTMSIWIDNSQNGIPRNQQVVITSHKN